jgi:tetratricopeptide (TPR) repeat protein
MWRKSQIAIEYAYRYHATHPQSHVFWVYAASAARFDQAYKDIARKVKLPRVDDPDVDVCELVSDWLNNDDSGEWLMILDNADNRDLFLQPVNSEVPKQVNMMKKPLIDYLPINLTSKRSLLITTRNRLLGEIISDENPCTEVRPFAFQEAKELLRSRAGDVAESWSDTDSDTLVEVLGYIPLAITQSAAFVKRYRTPLPRYLKSLEKHEQNLKDALRREFEDYTRERDFPNAVFQTWEISFDQMRKQEPRAAEMLSLMSMFDRQKIPEDLLRRPGERDVEFFAAIGTLEGLSLITTDLENETFMIHRLVQLSIHIWIEQHNENALYEEKSLALLAGRFPEGELGDRNVRESLFPHAQAVLRYDLVSEACVIHRADLLRNIGWFDWQQGRYDIAYQKGLESYELYRKQGGYNDPRTLKSSNLVAFILLHQGKYEESEKLCRRALELFKERLGAEHLDVLDSVSEMAMALAGQGKYKEAEEKHRLALEGERKVLEAEHPTILASISNLALVLRRQGKYEKAEEMNRRALKGIEKALGVEHSETLTFVANLASVLRRQGKYEEAEEMNRRVLKGREKVLRMDHPDTLVSVAKLASVLRRQGKYEEAEEMNRRALKGIEKALGVEHPETLTLVANLASILGDQGKYEEGEEMNRRALKGIEKALGVEHPETLTLVANLASVLRRQRKYEEAEEMNRRVLKGREKVLGMDHPDTLVSVAKLASVLRRQGKYEEAEEMNRRALEGRKKVLGVDHPDTLKSVANLASVRESMKRRRG